MLDIKNRLVNFKMCDVYMPEPRDFSLALHSQDILQGRVLDLSDSGSTKHAFAVVQIEGFAGHVVVPMEHIIGVL